MSVESISAPSGMIIEGPELLPGPSQPSVPSGNINAIRLVVLMPVLDWEVASVAFAS